MRVRPIHFVPDVAAAVRFYEALGLRAEARSRSGHWIELTATAGELCLHDAAIAADGQGRTGIALNFVADEPLETVETNNQLVQLREDEAADGADRAEYR